MLREGNRDARELRQPVEWSRVHQDWRQAEEERWRPLYESRGFKDWWEWRQTYVAELGLEQREWSEEMVQDPHQVIPQLVIGGFPGWKQYRPLGRDLATFADIVIPPTPGELAYNGSPRVDVRTNQTVMGLVGNLHETTLMGLACEDLKVALDGAHRDTATAIEAQDGSPRSSFTARMRWCQFDPSERHLLEAFARDRKAVTRT